MIVKKIKGDLIKLAKEGHFNAIAHGCNCFNTMSKGIAKQIKIDFPLAYQVDLSTVKGDIRKLGTYTVATVNNINGELDVINCYTQYKYYGNSVLVDYNAIRSCFEEIDIDYDGLTVGIPKIGAGLAGGDWNVIENIINEATPNVNIVLVELKE